MLNSFILISLVYVILMKLLCLIQKIIHIYELKKSLLEELSERITGCECCNSTYDREDSMTFFYFPHCNFEELLDEIGFSESQKNKIYENFSCPNCGIKLDSFSEVTVDEYYYDRKLYKAHIKKINKKESALTDFYKYLCKFPYLGCNHNIGRELISAISAINKTTISDKTFYRARSPNNSDVFTNKDMLPPNPSEIPVSEGRFNHFAQSHWYLGDSKNLCGIECTHNKNSILWFQEIKIVKAENILDLSNDDIIYYNPENPTIFELPLVIAALFSSGFITRPQNIKGYWKPEYLITRFIADICKQNGFNGILYPSSLYPSGKNLVIFNINKIEYSFIGNPVIDEFKTINSLDEQFLF